MIKEYLVSSFHGNAAKLGVLSGNQHIVAVLDGHSSTEVGIQKSIEHDPFIYVELNPLAETQASLRFYHRGREILNCGSGTLAAAKVFFDAYSQLNTAEFSTVFGLNTVKKLNERLGYTRKKSKMENALASERKIVQRILLKPVKKLINVGGSKGYWIAELQSERDIKNLKPRLRNFKRMAKPALIVTAKASRAAHYDYVMRYFAPQFGNFEDAATGSANLLLIQYWSSRIQKRLLHGLQLSESGGEFFGLCKANVSEIYGRVQ